MEESVSFDIRNIILNKQEPIVIKNVLKWKILQWTLSDWKSALHNEKLEFRRGFNTSSNEPQWERKTKLLKGDFEYFLNHAQNNTKEWLYFDYKQLNTWFKDNQSIRQELEWDPLGFPNIKPEDCTIWIGSKGAHTSCHMDCYGFNLVYQIYGSKIWLLFPPEENLKPSRIPYEESSIYSKLNFFSPNVNDFIGLSNKCRKVILNPGDMLFVPHKWWHYVENLETSISINVWLPKAEDDKERVKESIVQYFVKQITETADRDENNRMLNPNMDEVILGHNKSSFMETIHKCRKIYQDKLSNKKSCTECQATKNKTEPTTTTINVQDVVYTVPVLTKDEFLEFLYQQANRFHDVESSNTYKSDDNDDTNKFLEAITHPEVVDLIANILINN
ncbi:HSPB1-associated protein 1 [Diabrotica virgifera virgifera]|uniref:JmjC domain-containing protein n=1 Tax=Diabrotica virgifera virgifera TaxID=50390 RepID=A0ABM5JQH9_DIAVI|nr:HSPB1-associated protein 1 [Diabrotica virgifera virgifera]